jgi:hypothetical protein
MIVVTVGVYGAPPMFVLQPFLYSNDAQLGTVRGGAGLVLTLTGEHVLLMSSEADAKQQKEVGESEHYDEGSEESRDWKEDEGQNEKEQVRKKQYHSGDYSVDENEEQNQKAQEGKEDHGSGDYSVGTKHEENEDYYEKSYEESTTERKVLEESDDYHEKGEGESEDYESNSENGSGEQEDSEENSTEESYVEEDESTTESEAREGKSTRGNGNVDNNESESDCEKSPCFRKENGEYHNAVPNIESKRQTVEITSNQNDVKGVEHVGNAAINKPENKKAKLGEPMKNDQVKHIYASEEIVIGHINKSRTEFSKNQDATNTEGFQDEDEATDSSEATTLNPSLKETEEVQLVPVVYRVSPKLLQTPPVQITEV